MKRLAGVLILLAIAWGFSSWRRHAASLQTPQTEENEAEPVQPAALPRLLPNTPIARGVAATEPSAYGEPSSMFTPEPMEADWRTLPLVSGLESSPHWPQWKCADMAGSPPRSLWILEGAEPVNQIYRGTCADWQRMAPPVEEAPPPPPQAALRDRDFGEVRGWEGWQCADDPDGGYQSFWRLPGHEKESAIPFAGTCSAWSGRKSL